TPHGNPPAGSETRSGANTTEPDAGRPPAGRTRVRTGGPNSWLAPTAVAEASTRTTTSANPTRARRPTWTADPGRRRWAPVAGARRDSRNEADTSSRRRSRRGSVIAVLHNGQPHGLDAAAHTLAHHALRTEQLGRDLHVIALVQV